MTGWHDGTGKSGLTSCQGQSLFWQSVYYVESNGLGLRDGLQIRSVGQGKENRVDR